MLVAATIAGALVLDLAIPSYRSRASTGAGHLAALTLRVRTTIACLVCLGLGIYVIVIQNRVDGRRSPSSVSAC